MLPLYLLYLLYLLYRHRTGHFSLKFQDHNRVPVALDF
jgi:hypothetical protein